MPTVADVLAQTLREEGITRIFGLPGGEILDFIDAARRAGIEFLLTRQEATASFMADVTGQITRRPGVCAATLGPGAVNMTLGIANAYLDRSPALAITAAHALAAKPYATHQKLDLNAVYRPFTKLALTLDGTDTAETVRRAIRVSVAPRMGPVHLALPSDVARAEDRATGSRAADDPAPSSPSGSFDEVMSAIARARRPVVILGIDLDPHRDVTAVRAFVDALGLPVFVTPKAKGMLPEDQPLFCGVCAGVAGDAIVVDLFRQADLLIGVGFEPVESDKLWHQSMTLVSIGPTTIAADGYRPHAEVVGDLAESLTRVRAGVTREFEWPGDTIPAFRSRLDAGLSGPGRHGVSGYDLTRRLRELFPRDTVFTTDVGSIKMIATQVWRSYEPLAFFESNGLSAMSYSLPAAMAARLQFPDRPILCTIGDGGLGMTMADIETCVRERLTFVTVVYNDSSLSLINAAQQRRRQPTCGVRYGAVDFAAAARALGAWGARVDSLSALDPAIREAQRVDGPAVVDVVVDPAAYR